MAFVFGDYGNSFVNHESLFEDPPKALERTTAMVCNVERGRMTRITAGVLFETVLPSGQLELKELECLVMMWSNSKMGNLS